MKPLIAVLTCWTFEVNGHNDALRRTWLKDAKGLFDYKFFVGTGQGAEAAALPPDTVFLPDVDDGQGAVTYKLRAALRWVCERDYEFVYRCFPDTYARPERLLTCGFDAHDYHGDFRGEHATPDNYPSGGPGNFMSRRVMELALDAPIEGPGADGKHTRVWPYADDLWFGQVLNWHRDKGFRYFDDTRFINRGSRAVGPLKTNSIVATHLSCPDYPKPYSPGIIAHMLDRHRAWLASQ